MTAAPLPRHSLDHRSPLPTRAPEIAVPSLTGSRQTPHVHERGDAPLILHRSRPAEGLGHTYTFSDREAASVTRNTPKHIPRNTPPPLPPRRSHSHPALT